MNSYQKLKDKNKKLQDEINHLLNDAEYWLRRHMANNIKKGINEAMMFGEPYMIHKPNGKIRATGFFKKLIGKP